MRGVYTSTYLGELADAFARKRGIPALDVGKGFDLIVGTSTGAIVACALTAGVPLRDVVSLSHTAFRSAWRRLAAVAGGLGWKPVPSGANVVLLGAPDEGVWYGLQQAGEEPVVSDVQLYLDLAGTKGRGEEAASFILEQRLRPRW